MATGWTAIELAVGTAGFAGLDALGPPQAAKRATIDKAKVGFHTCVIVHSL